MITVSNYNAGQGNSSSGGSSNSGISSLQEGPGINIQNPNGPTSTIANTGVLSLEAGTDISVANNNDGSWTINSIPYSPWELPNNSNNNTIILNSNPTSGLYNPFVNNGNQTIAATGTVGSEFLVLTSSSTINSGVKVGSGQVTIGAGGSSSVSENYIAVTESGEINVLAVDKVEIDGGMQIVAGADTINIVGNNSVGITGNVIELDAGSAGLIQLNTGSSGTGTISTSGTVSFNKVPTCSATQPAISDDSTKIPTTAWVQDVLQAAILQPNKTYTLQFTAGDPVTYTIPANVMYVDIVLIGAGGLCGASATGSGGGIWYGGAGGGGAVCSINKVTVWEGQQFQYQYDANGKVTLSFTLNSLSTFDVMCQIDRAADGTAATSTGGGNGGTGQSTANTDNQYGAWFVRPGSNGANANTLNTIPSSGGRPGGRNYIAGQRGMGQQAATTGSWGRPIFYLTLYFI
jgi:hypothetical protein